MKAILGLDPGLRQTGWGIIEGGDDGAWRAQASGTIKIPPAGDLADRLYLLDQALAELLKSAQAHEAAVESAFAGSNIHTAFKLGLAHGLCLLAPARAGLPVAEYMPRTIKKSVTGYGNATKEQIRFMVAKLLPGSKPNSEHAADALAIALTHAHHHRRPALERAHL